MNATHPKYSMSSRDFPQHIKKVFHNCSFQPGYHQNMSAPPSPSRGKIFPQQPPSKLKTHRPMSYD